MLDRRYTQLYLHLGNYEGMKVPFIGVGGYFEEGFKTWQEALHHFRTALTGIVKLRSQDDEKEKCSQCKRKNPNDSTINYCAFCGRRLRTDESLNEQGAERFCEWFELEFHQFDDWDVLESLGWQVGRFTTGGWVSVSDFAALLEHWDDFDNDTDRFDSFDIQTGDCTLDDIDGDNPHVKA